MLMLMLMLMPIKISKVRMTGCVFGRVLDSPRPWRRPPPGIESSVVLHPPGHAGIRSRGSTDRVWELGTEAPRAASVDDVDWVENGSCSCLVAIPSPHRSVDASMQPAIGVISCEERREESAGRPNLLLLQGPHQIHRGC